MPASKKHTKNKKGGEGTVVNKEVSTANSFTSSRNPSLVNLSGSAPKSSEGIKPISAQTQSIFSPSNKSRLLSVPATAASAAAAATAVASSIKPAGSSGGSVLRYLIVIFILAFLVLTLYLYLEKPKTTTINHLYDPVFDFFDKLERKDNNSAIKKLEKAIDEKIVVNNIDNKDINESDADTDSESEMNRELIKEKKYKKKPVIPQADDATSQTQRKPKSKSGYCFIGEDKGFRSCIEVGEGDICMSGDIFPTQAICINPNLRE
jgi:hypothetical protein